jgi:hypothetical protein
MTPLEQRYRTLLRRLPASYRRRWEDDMVATYLAATVPADPEDAEYVEQCGRPSRAERASITRLAVRLRLGGVGDPPHARTWGDAVRRVALAGLLANALIAMSGVWRNLWLIEWLPGSPMAVQEWGPAGPLGVWRTVMELADVLWVVAFVAVVIGRRRTAAVTGAIACVPITASVVYGASFFIRSGFNGFLLTQVALAIVAVAPLVALLAFHAQSPPVADRPWLLGLAGAAVLAAVPAYVSLLPAGFVLDRPGVLAVGVAVGATVHLLRSRQLRTDLAWTLGLAIMAGVVLALRAISLLDVVVISGATDIEALLAVGMTQAVVVAGLGAVLWARAARGLRDLPVAADPAPPPPVLTA